MATKGNQEVEQTQMFLYLEGIDGGSKAKGYENQFDLIGVEHSIKRPAELCDIPTEETAHLSYSSLNEYSYFKVQIRPNYTYTQLMNALFNGTVIEKAVFTAVESNVEILKIEFEHVVIRQFLMNGKSSEDEIDEETMKEEDELHSKSGTFGSVEFSYFKMRFDYTSQNKNLGAAGRAVVEADITPDHMRPKTYESSKETEREQRDSTRDSTGSDRNYAAKTPSPFTPKEPEAKKEREKRELIRAAKGPAKAEFGARVKNRETGNSDIKTYRYRLTNFPGDITKAERDSLKDLQWGVRIGEEGAFKPLDDQQGIEIDLTIEYEHATRTIYVGPMIGGTVPEHLQVETTIPFTVPLVPEIMIRMSEKESDPRRKFINAVKLQDIWFNTPEKSIFYDGQKDITKQFFNNTIITLAWIKSFERGLEMYEKFIKMETWFTYNLKKALLGKFIANKLLEKQTDQEFGGFPKGEQPLTILPDPNKDMLLLNHCYMQHMAWKWTQADSNDDLKATLANCDWRMAVEGVIKPKDKNGRWLVQITRCAIFIRDSFDYVGSQFGGLGDWRVHPPDLMSIAPPFIGYTGVDNKMYRDWREEYGIGHDFLVFSDVEYLEPKNAVFEIVEDTDIFGNKNLMVPRNNPDILYEPS